MTLNKEEIKYAMSLIERNYEIIKWVITDEDVEAIVKYWDEDYGEYFTYKEQLYWLLLECEDRDEDVEEFNRHCL